MIRLILPAFALFLTAAPALAQDGPPPIEDGPPPIEFVEPVVDTSILLGASPESVQELAVTWADAWAETPALVTLQVQENTSDREAELEARLKLLGEKTFSNREWKTYWQQQSELSSALSEALRQASGSAGVVARLDQWTELANNKVTNQDAFFEAIESERDALEDGLETAMEATETPSVLAASNNAEPTPYTERRLRLERLERDMDAQTVRRGLASSEVEYVEKQLATEQILGQALERDLELAETELSISQDMAQGADAWGALWGAISEKTATKVETIRAELQYGKARTRSREVELGLAHSQIEFRDSRIAELQVQYDEEGSSSSLMEATWQTVLLWLRSELWHIALGLGLVYIGVRFGLRLVNRTTAYLLQRTDDDPDTEDDGDQRRETLADVFLSMAKIGIYVIGGLLALEQIGVNTGPLLGSVAILGLAISFGSQNLVRDIVNGFFILLENQYAVGDVVTINGLTGTVERITIRSTWMRSYNGDLHIMPNGGISTVSNLTRGWSRTIAEVGVSYGADLDAVERVLNEVGQVMYVDADWKGMLEEAPTYVGVVNLADSSVGVRMIVMVSAGNQWGVQRELYRRMKNALDAAGIEIPFPQMVLHKADS